MFDFLTTFQLVALLFTVWVFIACCAAAVCSGGEAVTDDE